MAKSLKERLASGELHLDPEPGQTPTLREQVQSGQASSSPDEKVGALETFLSNAVDSIPFAGALTNLGMAGRLQYLKSQGFGTPSAQLTPAARAEAARLGIDVLPPDANAIPDPVESYRQARDMRATRERAGSEQHPSAALFGEGVGTGLSFGAPLPAFKIAEPIASGVVSGAIYGAENALEHGGADLTKGQIGKAATQALAGGALGSALGAGAGGVQYLAPYAAEAFNKRAADASRRVLEGGSDIAQATREPISNEAALHAIDTGGVVLGGTTQGAFGRITQEAKRAGNLYDAILTKLEDLGVMGPDAKAIADQLTKRAAELRPNTMNKAIPAEYEAQAAELLQKSMGGGLLGLKQTESLKRSLQKMAKYGKIEETPVNEARRDIASIVRQANEDAVAQAGAAARPGSETAQAAEEFVPAKRALALTLEARAAAKRGNAKVLGRATQSLPEQIAANSALATGDPASAVTGNLLIRALGALKRRGSSTSAVMNRDLATALENYRPEPFARVAGQQATLLPEESYRIQALIRQLQSGAPDGEVPVIDVKTGKVKGYMPSPFGP